MARYRDSISTLQTDLQRLPTLDEIVVHLSSKYGHSKDYWLSCISTGELYKTSRTLPDAKYYDRTLGLYENYEDFLLYLLKNDLGSEVLDKIIELYLSSKDKTRKNQTDNYIANRERNKKILKYMLGDEKLKGGCQTKASKIFHLDQTVISRIYIDFASYIRKNSEEVEQILDSIQDKVLFEEY